MSDLSDIYVYKNIETIIDDGKNIKNDLNEYEMRIISFENEIRITFINVEKVLHFVFYFNVKHVEDECSSKKKELKWINERIMEFVKDIKKIKLYCKFHPFDGNECEIEIENKRYELQQIMLLKEDVESYYRRKIKVLSSMSDKLELMTNDANTMKNEIDLLNKKFRLMRELVDNMMDLNKMEMKSMRDELNRIKEKNLGTSEF